MAQRTVTLLDALKSEPTFTTWTRRVDIELPGAKASPGVWTVTRGRVEYGCNSPTPPPNSLPKATRLLAAALWNGAGGVIPVPKWLPDDDPLPGENFLGIDRSVDPTRLAGARLGRREGETILDAVLRGVRAVLTNGGKPDLVCLPRYDCRGSHEFAYPRAVSTQHVRFIRDWFAPPGRAYVLTLASWSLLTCGEPWALQEREPNRTGGPRRWYYSTEGQLVCRSPAQNAVVLL